MSVMAHRTIVLELGMWEDCAAFGLTDQEFRDALHAGLAARLGLPSIVIYGMTMTTENTKHFEAWEVSD